MLKFFFLTLLIVGVLFSGPGCEECQESTCPSECEALGFAGGMCRDNVCQCSMNVDADLDADQIPDGDDRD